MAVRGPCHRFQANSPRDRWEIGFLWVKVFYLQVTSSSFLSLGFGWQTISVPLN